MSIDDWDDPSLNKRLVHLIDVTIDRCQKAYEGKAKSFAVVLNELELLSSQLNNKMNFSLESAEELNVKQKTEELRAAGELGENEKFVYARIFHKDMSKLGLPEATLTWMKPLIESIKTSEKSGIAIYESELDVKKSLRNGEHYAYATLRIDKSADLTEAREPKIDPNLNCKLLTIAQIEFECIVKFTYDNKDYPIVDGVIQR